MTTGAPIYLVSACASGEEFVAAFRRYADRNGVVFVPIAEPLPAGKKARFALTLRDGGVMIDGEAEVVSSARTPSVMYGRIGMTVKFVAPDEPSKTVLAELEKARLALKPAPPSVAPRSADVPPEPRPTPPAPSGRVDTVNALAECVAIGDLGQPLERPRSGTIPPQIGAKFAVPAIPRPSASVPPPLAGKPGLPPTPPRVPTPPAGTSLGMKPVDKAPAPPRVTPPAGTSLGMRPVDKAPAPPRQVTPPAGTSLGMKPVDRVPAPPIVAEPPVVAATQPARDDATTPTPLRVAATNDREDATLPAAPAPPTVAAAQPAISRDDEDEPTDLTEIPIEGGAHASIPVEVAPQKSGRESRRTSLGVPIVPEGMVVRPATPASTPAEPDAPDASVPAQDPGPPIVAAAAAQRPAVQVEESTPSGDWTMTPGANGPTITPTPRAEKKAPPGPPTGDWIVALDPSRPDGWSEPSKIEKRPAGELPPGPPMTEVASAEPLDSEAHATPEPADASAEPKVQIDPTLIEPLTPMPALDDEVARAAQPLAAPPAEMVAASGASHTAIPTPVPGTIPPPLSQAIPGSYVTPLPQPSPFASATGPNPAYGVSVGGLPPQYPRAATMTSDAVRRRRMIVIAASAGAAVIVGIVLLIVLGGGKDEPANAKPIENLETAPPQPEVGSAAPDPVGEGSAEVPVDPDVEVAVATPDAAPPEVIEPVATDCELRVVSAPSGAEILLDKTSLGTTPATIHLPCDVEARLVFKKARYAQTARTVTPKAGQRPLKVGLARITFSVKVSSTPAGATISVGGRSMGTTPTTLKLPAYEASTLKISRPGYIVETQKVTPKQNNQTVHAKLKKAPRRR